MTTPSINDYPLYTNTPLTDTDWKNLVQATVNSETDGTKDFTINSLHTTAGVVAGTSVTAATATVTGAVTAGSFVGDGSLLTNTSIQQKNHLINGDGRLNTLAPYTLVINVYSDKRFNGVNYWEGMATGTLVSAGTFGTVSNASVGRSGYAIKFAGTTLTGTGVLYLRYRMPSKDAVNFIGQIASFSSKVYHDVGSAINYTVTFRKANAVDDFSTTTLISANTAQSVPSATSTAVNYANVSLGACGYGLEIEIKVEPGAITTKNFYFTEMQCELSTIATNYEYNTYELQSILGTRSKQLLYDYTLTTATGAVTSITVSGLTGDTAIEYDVSIDAVNNSTGSPILGLQFNGDAANYYAIYNLNDGTTNSLGKVSSTGYLMISPYAAGVANVHSYSRINIYAKSGQYRHVLNDTIIEKGDGTAYISFHSCGFYSISTGELTSITLYDTVASGIAAGTRIQIYGRTA